LRFLPSLPSSPFRRVLTFPSRPSFLPSSGGGKACCGTALTRTVVEDPQLLSEECDIFLAVKHGHLDRVQEIFAENGNNKDTLKEVDDDGHTLMHWASLGADMDMVKWLVSNGAPFNQRSSDDVGMEPLHWACTKGNMDAVHHLLVNGGDINCLDKKGCTPLIIAAQYAHPLLVSYLIKNGADHTIIDKENDSALHWAAYKGNVEILSLLQYLGLPIDTADNYGQTPLHLASLRGNLEAVEYLVENEVRLDLTVKDAKEKTAHDLAVDKHHAHVAIYLGKKEKGSWIDWFESGEKSKVPLMTVFFNVGFSWMLYPNLISCPTIGFSGGFWAFSIIAHLLMAFMHISCWTTDPGGISDVDVYKEKYDELLSDVASSGTLDPVKAALLNRMCHTCHILRPLRAKHCRATKQCVVLFDHFCPFVSNCVGGKNYPYFYGYVVFHNVAIHLFVYAQFTYLMNCENIEHMTGNVLILIYYTVFCMLGWGMLSFHTWLVISNLTTNEYSNQSRYAYLKNDYGAFSNPFDNGYLQNAIDKLFMTDNLKHINPPAREQMNKEELDRLL
jgi:ankyrin repeat protein